MRFRMFVMLIAALFVAACNAYQPRPTPVQSPTPRPTVVPSATVGPLSNTEVEKLGLTMLAPSTWKAPSPLNDNSVVLSPDGSTDTSPTAGPFLLIMSGDSKFFHSKLSFPEGLTDPVDQLSALIKAMNIDAPEIGPVTPYEGAQYPAAIVHLFERGLERTIVLMNAGNDRWLYVGAQSLETYFKYYEDAVFKPATDSIRLK
jgi:hypothetical protein